MTKYGNITLMGTDDTELRLAPVDCRQPERKNGLIILPTGSARRSRGGTRAGVITKYDAPDMNASQS